MQKYQLIIYKCYFYRNKSYKTNLVKYNLKKALITGITGQDGAYLADFLINKGYTVYGIKRRTSRFISDRVDHLLKDHQDNNKRLTLLYGDLTDSLNICRIIQEVSPDEIYNLGAMSHVHVSFESPEYTANVDAIGTLRILESIRILGMTDRVKFYQALRLNYMEIL